MDDFEFSVEISEHDWSCFIQECRECVVFSPALARVDDSGMSDMDDLGPVLTDGVVKAGHTAALPEADCSSVAEGPPGSCLPDSPPDRKGSPLEHRHTAGGMESVLSGSEEDIHLASINTFFERMRNLAEAGRASEPSQEGAGENKEERGRLSDGPQASDGTEPRHILKINSLPARGETTSGRQATWPPAEQSAKRNTETTRTKDVPDSTATLNLAPGGTSHVETNEQTRAESFVRLAIAEEPGASTVADVRGRSASRGPREANVCADVAVTARTCKHADAAKQRGAGTDLTALNRVLSVGSPSRLKTMTQDRWEEDTHCHSLLADKPPQSPQWSPSPSAKKKRRKKRRVSNEPFKSGHGYERQFLANQSDSEVEPYSHGRGWDQPLSQDSIACITETERTDCSAAPLRRSSDFFQSKASSNLLLKISSMGNSFKPLSPSIPLNNCQLQNIQARPDPSERRVLANSHDNGVICSALELSGDNTVKLLGVTGCDMTSPADCASVPAHVQTHGLTQLLKPVALPGSRAYDEIHSPQNLGHPSETPQRSHTADVTSAAYSVSASHAVAASQNDQVSTAKKWLAKEIGNFGRETLTLGQRELKGEGSDITQYKCAYENSVCPLAITGADMQELSANSTKQQHINTEPGSASNYNLSQDPGIDITLETSDSSPNARHQVEHFHHQLSKLDSVSENNTLIGVGHSTPLYSVEFHTITSNTEMTPELSMSEPVMSLLNTNVIEKACSSHNSNDLSPHILVAYQNSQGKSKPVQALSEHTFDGGSTTEEQPSAAEAQKPPDSNSTPFTMSSFWREMEKLTIKDLLCVGVGNNTAPSNYLYPLQEGEEESESSDARDSGYFAYADMPKYDNTSGEISSIPKSSSLNPPGIITDGSTQSANVLWERKSDLGSGMYPQNTLLSSVKDSSLPQLLNSSDDKYSRKISKNVSVRNLQALDSESFSNLWKGRDLQTVIPQDGESEQEYLSDGQEPRRHSKMDSLSPSSSVKEEATGIYRLSLTEILKYVFGKTQSKSSPSTEDSVTTSTYAYGQSVPETYDYFFSDFDTGDLFYPLTEAASDTSKDELVSVFSYPCSVNKNLQYPEAYEHFFASSSSDDSSVESDEEDNEGSRGPIHIVTRLSRKTSDPQVTSDVYDNFFSDRDVKQNFFWKNTLSLRKVHLRDFMSQEQRSNSFIFGPVNQRGPSLPDRKIQPFNARRHKDKPFPFLFNAEDKIPSHLEQHFSFDDLQTAVSNPRLDAPLLRQSDMCLVCIAFASWVLKTTNPEVGDAWKAVLLANVSALSAIGYLRKHLRVMATADQKALDINATDA